MALVFIVSWPNVVGETILEEIPVRISLIPSFLEILPIREYIATRLHEGFKHLKNLRPNPGTKF
jgi:hypothetical protein